MQTGHPFKFTLNQGQNTFSQKIHLIFPLNLNLFKMNANYFIDSVQEDR